MLAATPYRRLGSVELTNMEWIIKLMRAIVVNLKTFSATIEAIAPLSFCIECSYKSSYVIQSMDTVCQSQFVKNSEILFQSAFKNTQLMSWRSRWSWKTENFKIYGTGITNVGRRTDSNITNNERIITQYYIQQNNNIDI